MSNAWGQLSWNAGLWGNQSDAIATPIGFGLNAEQGTTAGFPFPGWGSLSWGSGQFGDVQDFDVQVTGQVLNSNIGNVGVSGEINAGWGRLEFGENAWGIAGDVIVTGIGLDAGVGVGTVTATATSAATGQQLNLDTGTVTAVGLAEVDLTGFSLSADLGTVDAAPDAMVTGIGLDVGLGTIQAYNEQGWGRDSWGDEVWGAQGIWVDVSLTGQGLTVDSGIRETWGTENWGSFEWGGSYVTDVDILTNAAVTGQELTVEEGIVDPSPDATVVGLGLSASVAVGSVVEADANVVINNDAFTTFNANGDAQLSTTQAKFGASSLLLNGTNSYVSSTVSDFVNGDFTVEFFAYASSFAQDAILWDNRSGGTGIAIGTNSSSQIKIIKDSVAILTGFSGFNNNAFNHIALVRSSGQYTIYVNGVSRGTAQTYTDNYTQQYFIGSSSSQTEYFNGYIDEFRASTIARYTSGFTPPSSAFTTDSDTTALLHFDGANGSTDIVNEVAASTPRIAVGVQQGQAELDAVTFAAVTGQQLEVDQGTAVAGASAEVFPTGIGLTVSTNSINVQSWQIVDTGTNVNWNNIDTAA